MPAAASVHVAIDALAFGQRPAGVGRYAVNLLRGLAALPCPPRVTVIARHDARAALSEALGAAAPPMTGPGALASRPPLRLLWEQLRLQPVATRAGCTLLHGLMAAVPHAGRLPAVVTIHDVTFLTHPQFHTATKVAYFRAMLPRAAATARRILTDSEASRTALTRALQVDPARVDVVPLCADPGFSPPSPVEVASALARYRIERPFLLYAGVLEPRKNLGRLVEALLVLRAAGYPHPLLIAGKDGWGARSVGAALARGGAAVRRLGFVPDADLRALYGACDAFAYVPEVEGFGLPVVEALACGAAVVTSHASSLPEAAGGAALLVDPLDPQAIAAGLARLLDDAELRANLRRRGLARAAELTPQRMATGTLHSYLAALDSPAPR